MPASGSVLGYAEDVLQASSAQTTGGNSGALPGYGGANTLRLQLNVTAVSGTATPTLTVFIEDTLDGTNWNQIVAFTAATATGIQAVNVTTPFADRLRVRWTITGTTPSITFEVRAASQSPMA